MGNFEKVAPAKAVTKVDDQAEIKAIREDLALKENAIKALEEHAKEASAPTAAHVKLDDGIHFATNDGNFTAGINGRLQVDSQTNFENNGSNFVATGGQGTAASPYTQSGAGLPSSLNDGVTLRRARLGVEGTFFKTTDYKFEYDFGRGNGLNAGGITDAYIRYNFSKPFSVKFGSFKEPFSMEEATSNRYLTFIERNMAVNTFVDNLNTYKVGAGANYAADRWQTGVSFQTEGVGGYNAYGNNALTSNTGSAINPNGGVNRNGGGGDTSWEANARVSGTPWMADKTKFLHTGLSGSYININNNYTANGTYSNGGIIFANGLAGNVDRTSILTTGNLTSTGKKTLATATQADSLTRFGAETAVVYGPFSAQAEYIRTNLSGKGINNDTLDGFYAYGTYFLTGESRNYNPKTGSWGRIKPSKNFDMKGGWGAWEFATGYDYMNLNSGVIQGGRASTAKAGINWYPNSHVRVMANYIHALDINTGTAKSTIGAANYAGRAFNNADLDMVETRIQLDW
jgi:phosphate-selective porin OprO/OprP